MFEKLERPVALLEKKDLLKAYYKIADELKELKKVEKESEKITSTTPASRLPNKELLRKYYHIQAENMRLKNQVNAFKFKKPPMFDDLKSQNRSLVNRNNYLMQENIRLLTVVSGGIIPKSYDSDLTFVSDLTGVDSSLIVAKAGTDGAKKQHVFTARYILYYILRQRGLSLNLVGEKVGGRDHSSIINGLNKYTSVTTPEQREKVLEYLTTTKNETQQGTTD